MALYKGKGGDAAKRVAFNIARPLLLPAIDKLETATVSWPDALGVLEDLPLAELELIFEDPWEFAEMLFSKLARIEWEAPALLSFLNEKGFEWSFFAPILDNMM